MSLFALTLAAPGFARSQETGIAQILAEAGEGTRWGVMIVDAKGQEIIAINPDGRFMPASNTKIFVTAAAFWVWATTDPAVAMGSGTSVTLVDRGEASPPDVMLIGGGDAQLSSAPECQTRCLAALADAVAARTRVVGDIIGDDTAFTDERWSAGMSWNNIPEPFGTGISALSVDDNHIVAIVSPGEIGAAPSIALPDYYVADNRALTVAGDEDTLLYQRIPGSRILIMTGTIGTQTAPVTLPLGVDDPAHLTAWHFASMLTDRGVRITGQIRTQHRPLLPQEGEACQGHAPVQGRAGLPVLANIAPAPLTEGAPRINKRSQNLHAELLLRRLGLADGCPSAAGGQAVITAMLEQAGVAPGTVTLADGSGMSSYNRVTPRAVAALLTWIDRQDWGRDFRASLPVGGIDGTLSRRFTGTALEGKIFAKTGSLNATSALAGYMVTGSGQVLTFAIYANDVPPDVSATAIMDKALVHVAATH